MLRVEGSQAYVQYEPMGVILAVMPWNFPFWQVFRFAVPALMAGNTVLLKHAPSVPQCALRIESLIRQAGFERGALLSLLIEVDGVESVLSDPRVVGATVTGGENAGRAIAAQAGYLLKKTVLELGGSDPFVIMPSARITDAITAAVASRMVNGGQSCIAAKRFVVHNDVYAEVQDGMVRAMETLRLGDPMKARHRGGATEQREGSGATGTPDSRVRRGGRTHPVWWLSHGGERLLFRTHRDLWRSPHERRVQGGNFWAGCAVVPRERRGECHRDCERHAVRPGRIRVDGVT